MLQVGRDLQFVAVGGLAGLLLYTLMQVAGK